MAKLYLYNSLTRKKEEFVPLNFPQVGVYSCGPTVYGKTQIGHLRRYLGDDLLVRLLRTSDYDVTWVMNITDVGHLTSDDDYGDDKLDAAAKKKGLDILALAQKYEKHFWESLVAINVPRPDIICHATKNIAEQITIIKKLAEKGYIYQTPAAIYFDVSKFPEYGQKLSGQKLEDKLVGAREETRVDADKKNPQDFVLWFFTVGRFKDHLLRWDSPWGEGFPGWHLECSAMSMKYLGETIDIHTGGIDHLTVHHPNEIAQSEAATGKPFVRYWIHHNFLRVDGQKMGKSLGNLFTVTDVKDRGFDPLDLRFFFLTAHYRKPQNFTWEALKDAQRGFRRLQSFVAEVGSQYTPVPTVKSVNPSRQRQTAGVDQRREEIRSEYANRFQEAINDDLNTPQALAVIWDLTRTIRQDESLASLAYELILEWDQILGLGLGLGLDQVTTSKDEKEAVPPEVTQLVKEREKLRVKGKWEEADRLRQQIEKKGWQVTDAKDGSNLKRS